MSEFPSFIRLCNIPLIVHIFYPSIHLLMNTGLFLPIGCCKQYCHERGCASIHLSLCSTLWALYQEGDLLHCMVILCWVSFRNFPFEDLRHAYFIFFRIVLTFATLWSLLALLCVLCSILFPLGLFWPVLCASVGPSLIGFPAVWPLDQRLICTSGEYGCRAHSL